MLEALIQNGVIKRVSVLLAMHYRRQLKIYIFINFTLKCLKFY